MTEIIRRHLYDLQDSEYKAFNSKLIPNIEPNRIIGVRTPELKAYAKSLKNCDVSAFLSDLPHKYYEENSLHGFIIMGIKDYDECIAAINVFLPFVDNWATCDQLRPPCFKKHRAELIEQIKIWLESEHTYTKRFAMGMLMAHFLDEDFKPEYLEWLAEIRSEEYYVNMMLAWYYATALAKQWEATLPYLENCCLAKWVHNKTIQKAIESYRITAEQKAYLRTLRIK